MTLSIMDVIYSESMHTSPDLRVWAHDIDCDFKIQNSSLLTRRPSAERRKLITYCCFTDT